MILPKNELSLPNCKGSFPAETQKVWESRDRPQQVIMLCDVYFTRENPNLQWEEADMGQEPEFTRRNMEDNSWIHLYNAPTYTPPKVPSKPRFAAIMEDQP